MRPYILPTFLIILEILYFIYILARENNENFRERVQKIRIRILEKTKLNLDFKIKNFSKKSYIIFFLTFVFDDKMVVVIFITLFMILLIKLRISYEKFEEVFENYDPSIKKYNIYLSVLLLTQVLIIILTVVCLK